MDAILPAHPEPNRALFKHSFTIYKLSFKKVFGLALLLSFIVFIPRLLQDFTGINLFNSSNTLRLAMLLVDFIGVLIFISILWRVYHAIHGGKEPVKTDVKIGLRRVIAAFIASALQAIILIFVLLIFFLLEYFLIKNHLLFQDNAFGIIFTLAIFIAQYFLVLYTYTLFVFLVPIIALENKSIWSSIKRSVSLVWDHWWRVFSFQITPWVCFIITLALFQLIFHLNISLYFLNAQAPNVWITILQILIFSLFVPWVAAIILVQLRDLELRKHVTRKDKNAIH